MKLAVETARARLPEREARFLSHDELRAVAAEEEADRRHAALLARRVARAKELLRFLQLLPFRGPAGEVLPTPVRLGGLWRLARARCVPAPTSTDLPELVAFTLRLAEAEENTP